MPRVSKRDVKKTTAVIHERLSVYINSKTEPENKYYEEFNNLREAGMQELMKFLLDIPMCKTYRELYAATPNFMKDEVACCLLEKSPKKRRLE